MVTVVGGQVGCHFCWTVLLDCRWTKPAVKSYGILCAIEARIILYVAMSHTLWYVVFCVVICFAALYYIILYVLYSIILHVAYTLLMVSLCPTVAKLINIETQQHIIGIRSLGQPDLSLDWSLGSPSKPSHRSQAFVNNKTDLVFYHMSSPIVSSWQSLASPSRPDTHCV